MPTAPGTRKGQAVAVKAAEAATATLWAYEAEPNKQDYGWYENEVGRILRLGQTAPPDDWEATLARWPSQRG